MVYSCSLSQTETLWVHIHQISPRLRVFLNAYTFTNTQGFNQVSVLATLPTPNGDWSSLNMVTGIYNACIFSSNNNIYCWGSNSFYETLKSSSQSFSQILLPDNGQKQYKSVSMNYKSICVIKYDDKIYCAGLNTENQTFKDLAYAVKSKRVQINSNLKFKRVFAKYATACAISTDNRLFCWGDNEVSSACKYGSYCKVGGHDNPTPTEITITGLTGVTFKDVAVGQNHICVIVDSTSPSYTGAVYCWGDGTSGQLGHNLFTSLTSPTIRAGTTGVSMNATSIDAGANHTCFTTSSNQGYCFGQNTYGQLGDGTITNRSTPTSINLNASSVIGKTVKKVGTGDRHSCFVLSGFANPYPNEIHCVGSMRNYTSSPATLPATSTYSASAYTIVSNCNSSTAFVSYTLPINKSFGNVTNQSNVDSISITSTNSITTTNSFFCSGSPSLYLNFSNINNEIDNNNLVLSAPGSVINYNGGSLTTKVLGISGSYLPTIQPGLYGSVVYAYPIDIKTNKYSNCATLTTGKTACWGHSVSMERFAKAIPDQIVEYPVTEFDNGLGVKKNYYNCSSSNPVEDPTQPIMNGISPSCPARTIRKPIFSFGDNHLCTI